MIALTQIANTEMFAFIAVPVLKLISRKVLFINRKDNRNLKSRLLFLKKTKFHGQITKKLWIVGIRNFLDIFETRKRSFISAFLICMTVPLMFFEKS